MRRTAKNTPKDEKLERPKKKRGPEPERVKIDGDWEEAIKKALKAPPQKSK